MDDLLRRRIAAALDEAAELESERNRAESEMRFEMERKLEQEHRERTLRALERVAMAFERMSDSLQSIRTNGIQCHR